MLLKYRYSALTKGANLTVEAINDNLTNIIIEWAIEIGCRAAIGMTLVSPPV